MLLFNRFIISIFFIISFSSAAKADLDYKCLNNCANSGMTSSICMNKCSYGTQKKSSEITTQEIKKNPHNQFSPLELESEIGIKQKKEQINKPSINYPCLSKCLQEKSQYQFCEEQCSAKL